jgi:hypothetical protein
MFSRSFVGILPIVVALAGCSALPGGELRYGPSQQIDDTDVQTQMDRQHKVMASFAEAAGVAPLAAYGDPRWYLVVTSGFNYIDEKCDAYLRQLFILEREKARAKDSIVQVDKLTGAILGASGASSASIQVVAQAFGFGSTMTGIVADSYLYAVPLPTLFSTEEKLRKAYRDKAATQAKDLNNQPAAYQSIRGYLSLCFPQTIESQIVGAVAAAKAETGDEKGKTDEKKPTPSRAPPGGAKSSTMIRLELR